MGAKRNSKARTLERLVKLLESTLAIDATVASPGFVEDLTGRSREVDVLVREVVRGRVYVTGFECRAHGRAVGVGYVESAVTKRNDLRLDRMCVVSTNGFTVGAIKKAELHNIQLGTVENAEASEWIRVLFGRGFFELVQCVEVHGYRVEHVSTDEMPDDYFVGTNVDEVFLKDQEGNRVALSEAHRQQITPEVLHSIWENVRRPTAGFRQDVELTLRAPDGAGLMVEHGGLSAALVATLVRLVFRYRKEERKVQVVRYADHGAGGRSSEVVHVMLENGSLAALVRNDDGQLVRFVADGGDSGEAPSLLLFRADDEDPDTVLVPLAQIEVDGQPSPRVVHRVVDDFDL